MLRKGSAILYIRSSRVVFLLITSLILACFAAWVYTKEVPLQEATRKVFQSLWPSHSKYQDTSNRPRHPIDDLIRKANVDFERLTSKQTSNITESANAYRQRRGRHPPPRFDEWFKFAQSKNAVIIEDLFDRIYDDLTPFWALAPSDIRDAGASWPEVISIRNRALTVQKDKRYRIELWHDMLKRIAKYLPDVDLAFNTMDESRLFVPSETIDSYVAEASKRREASQQRSDSLVRDVILDYPLLPPYARPFHDAHFSGDTPIWSLTRRACSAATPGFNADIITDFASFPNFSVAPPRQTYHGFVANWTMAKSACHNPHLRGLHGTFIEPVSLSASTELFPLFGGSKLSVNNEILVPAPRYWENQERFSGGTDWYVWNRKQNGAFWRGIASGGRNREDTWRRFQRHRFVSMCNDTQIQAAMYARGGKPAIDTLSGAQNIADPRDFPLAKAGSGFDGDPSDMNNLSSWIKSHVQASFTDLLCYPETNKPASCPYTDPFFSVMPEMMMDHMYAHKLLPDIDGNSFSGRYRALLLSGSVPIKATIYDEWHDSRLIPWVHFVPMDNVFGDLWGLLQYFLGVEGVHVGHDAEAKRIAEQGRDWARKVLRKDDMVIYLFRVVLEYARLCSDDRDSMGFVGDLL